MTVISAGMYFTVIHTMLYCISELRSWGLWFYGGSDYISVQHIHTVCGGTVYIEIIYREIWMDMDKCK